MFEFDNNRARNSSQAGGWIKDTVRIGALSATMSVGMITTAAAGPNGVPFECMCVFYDCYL